MSFSRKFNTVILNTSNEVNYISLGRDILFSHYNNDTLLYSSTLFKGHYTFVDTYFDIDNDDSIYGLVSNRLSSLIYVYINDKSNVYTKTTLLKLKSNSSIIKFPYIKKINGTIHIFYFHNSKNKKYTYDLYHRYYKNNKWTTLKIDTVHYSILSNYEIIWKDDTPTIFYFNIKNTHEELFVSNFNSQDNSWSKPIQITNTHKTKVYLSVLLDKSNNYHIVFSENNKNKYYPTYIKCSLSDLTDKVNENKYIILKETLACSFPHLIYYDDVLYSQWIECNNLYTIKSYNNGDSWGEVTDNEDLYTIEFIRYYYKSNSLSSENFTLSTVFSPKNTFQILGLK